MFVGVHVQNTRVYAPARPPAQVGSGKSSLLAALLGELSRTSGRALADGDAFRGLGGVGYVGQSPWVVGGSIRDNVLMGEPYEPEWMQEVRG